MKLGRELPRGFGHGWTNLKLNHFSAATRFSLLALTVTVVTGLFATVGLAAIQDQIAEKQAAIEEDKHEEVVLAGQISELSSKERKLSTKVGALQSRVDVVASRYEQARAEYERELKRYQRLKERLKVAQIVLRATVQKSFEAGEIDQLAVIVGSNSWHELLDNVHMMEQIGGKNVDIIDVVRDLKSESKLKKEKLERLKERIERDLNELKRIKAQLETQQGLLEGARSQKQSTLNKIESHRHELELDVEGLTDKLAASSASTGVVPPGAAGPINQGGGTLGWPVRGPIFGVFGEQRPGHTHAGIDIGVPSGTPVHASDSGAVSFAGVQSGYGNLVCINHNHRALTTCSAHNSSISVSVGQRVSKGQVVASSGCTGTCYGPHVHFEVRPGGGAPVDPMAYLS